MKFFIISFTIATINAAEELIPRRVYCPALQICHGLSTELERWECLGRVVYSNKNKPEPNEIMVTHDCTGVGWGNAMRGLYGAVAISAVLGRRLMVVYDILQRNFRPPYGNETSSWDYGLESVGMLSPFSSQWEPIHRFTAVDTFNYEMHARGGAKRFEHWCEELKNTSTPWVPSSNVQSPSNTIFTDMLSYVSSFVFPANKMTHEDIDEHSLRVNAWSHYENKTLLNAGICGGEREMLNTGDCLSGILQRFTAPECFQQLPEFMLLIPFYYTLFRRPGPTIIQALEKIRQRLNLPLLPSGLENVPGAWGLRTPGYYIYALHFRRIPLGFEPSSSEINLAATQRQYRDEILIGFWETAMANVRQAKEIAQCRGEELLIYFASDDVRLRTIAREKLQTWGRVVWGLEAHEVGHVAPQWREKDHQEMEATAAKLISEGYYEGYQDGIQKVSMEMEIDPSTGASSTVTGDATSSNTVHARGSSLTPNDVIIQVNKDDQATRMHGDMTLVEWWILANAQWLQSHSGTSFSDTAAGWGLGPSGGMERLDVVHGRGHVQVAHRREWHDEGFCHVTGAADPVQALNCPNK